MWPNCWDISLLLSLRCTFSLNFNYIFIFVARIFYFINLFVSSFLWVASFYLWFQYFCKMTNFSKRSNYCPLICLNSMKFSLTTSKAGSYLSFLSFFLLICIHPHWTSTKFYRSGVSSITFMDSLRSTVSKASISSYLTTITWLITDSDPLWH